MVYYTIIYHKLQVREIHKNKRMDLKTILDVRLCSILNHKIKLFKVYIDKYCKPNIPIITIKLI
jgi:hypothetical protein